MTTPTVIGFLLIGFSMALGLVIMARLARIGNKRAFHGALGWVEYVRISKAHGWSGALVVWMLVALALGIGLVVAGANFRPHC